MARTETTSPRRRWGKALVGLFLAGILLLGGVFGVNAYVRKVGGTMRMTPEQAADAKPADCIVVFGCQVHPDGTPSHMLRDRLDRAIALYEAGVAPKLLMSGDHGRTEYNEVGAMKAYAVARGVPSEDVFMDHAGFSTYETVVRAKEVFCASRVVLVSQEYHLYRALYLAKQCGLDAYGVAAMPNEYAGQTVRDCREVAARVKDFAMGLFKPDPTFLGEAIPISGDGDVTDDSKDV